MICKNSQMDTQICKCPECYSPPGEKALAPVSGYAALVERWRRCSDGWTQKHHDLKPGLPAQADRAIVRAEIYSLCATELEEEMRHNDKLTDAPH